MKFDTVIIGGGLSGLACGISLAEKGKKCAVVSSGQGALHFFSGSFDLLGYIDGSEVESPIQALSSLNKEHPYSLIGVDEVERISNEIPAFLNKTGVKITGGNAKNHYRLTPIGNKRPTWLTIDEYITADDSFNGKKLLLLNVAGYLDMPVKFIATGLEQQGLSCDVDEISIPELEKRRENASEMRSVNISKTIETIGINRIADAINSKGNGYDVVLLPAVFGWNGNEQFETLKGLVKPMVKTVATLPPAVPGVRIQTLMRKYFQSLGGTILTGDIVVGGKIENGKLQWINTRNLEDEKLIAATYVLATGNFFSRGIAGAPNEIYEPIFGLDVNTKACRDEWYDERFFNPQPYMRFGVSVDNNFRTLKNGKTIENLYAIGSVLGGADQIKEASMGGVSLITGVHVAELISKR
ncbi:MAG: anaerobic glycerol-3-phosphate dehydrogenase subunit B [Muribaculaceae bacterium]|nr:anaerobic glycerol-3-phosphate dehydrogenase subunit B [Muribaculaceae bacterium]